MDSYLWEGSIKLSRYHRNDQRRYVKTRSISRATRSWNNLYRITANMMHTYFVVHHLKENNDFNIWIIDPNIEHTVIVFAEWQVTTWRKKRCLKRGLVCFLFVWILKRYWKWECACGGSGFWFVYLGERLLLQQIWRLVSCKLCQWNNKYYSHKWYALRDVKW